MSWKKDSLLKEAVSKFEESPFWNWLGLESHHIGVYASILDTTMGFTVRSMVGSPVVTVNMNINFLKAISSGTLWSKGKIISMGRSLVTVEAYVYDDEQNPLAQSTGTFKLVKNK